MHPIIEQIYSSHELISDDGRRFELNSAISEKEGDFITNCILSHEHIKKTLEIGCAFGLSSLFICTAIRGRSGAHHTILDPFQNTQWGGIGTSHLKRAGIDFFELIEERSEYALPDLAKRGDQFDFIFVDGWHTFDHTLVDLFYASRILSVGGLLVIDDVNMTSVRRAVDFVTDFPCYREVGRSVVERQTSLKRSALKAALRPFASLGINAALRPNVRHRIFENSYPTMIALEKISDDIRNWDWDSTQI